MLFSLIGEMDEMFLHLFVFLLFKCTVLQRKANCFRVFERIAEFAWSKTCFHCGVEGIFVSEGRFEASQRKVSRFAHLRLDVLLVKLGRRGG